MLSSPFTNNSFAFIALMIVHLLSPNDHDRLVDFLKQLDGVWSEWSIRKPGPVDLDARCGQLRELEEQLQSINPASLDSNSGLDDFEVAQRWLAEQIIRCEHTLHWPIGPFWGVHRNVAELGMISRFHTIEGCQRYLEEVAAFDDEIADSISRMRLGIAQSRTLPRSIIADVPMQIERILANGLKELEYPFSWAWEELPPGSRDALWARFVRTEVPNVKSALETLRTFVATEYLPACRESIAASDLPGGELFYRRLLQKVAETDLTPEQLYDLGRQEADRIWAEMIQTIRDTDFYTSRVDLAKRSESELFEAFRNHLQTESKFFCKDGNEVLRTYRDVCKRIDHALPVFFRTLPRLPFGVIAQTGHGSEAGVVGYRAGGVDVGMASVLTVDVSNVRHHPTYSITPYALHEGSPGHHLQVSLAIENSELSKFRRNAFFSTFGEGWAMYAERLGHEMYLYEGPYEKFGQLQSEMHRACRLVLDPAIHSLGWSRERATSYLRDRTLLSDAVIAAEINRYIAWPGQAVSYKLGELRIRELRATAERELGARFDIREFHDVVLGAGCVPLKTLDRRVTHWIEGKRAESPPQTH